MSAVAQPRLHHLALTVTDLDISIPWYELVFDVELQMDAPHPGGVGKVLADQTWQLMIVLHHHDTNNHAAFAETTTGLDHSGFLVPDRSDLEAWQAHLEANGVTRTERADRPLTQSPIADEDYGSVLVFRDPETTSNSKSSPHQRPDGWREGPRTRTPQRSLRASRTLSTMATNGPTIMFPTALSGP